MEQLVLTLAHRALAAGWLVLAIAALRLILKNAPRGLLCLLWALVAFRLVCPVTLHSPASLVPRTESVVQVVQAQGAPISPAENTIAATDVQAPPRGLSPTEIFSWVWLAGAASMGLYAVWSDLRLRRRLRSAAHQSGNVWLCDEIDTPFVRGVLAPKIYLPSGLDPRQAVYVLAHERAHLRRRDHWWKPLGWALLSVYWFHPLMWLAWVLFCRDLELACDECVARRLDREGLAAYSQALLDCSKPRSGALICPVAFGEVGIKQRVKAVLRYRKPGFWIVLAAVILGCAAAVFFLTERPAEDIPAYFAQYRSAVLAGDKAAAAEMRWFENDTRRQMYFNEFQRPERFDVTQETQINENLWAYTCLERLADGPEHTIYQFAGRYGGRLWIYANINQVPERLSAGLDRSLYDYHEDENVMFADEDEQTQAIAQADAKALIAAYPSSDGAYTEGLLSRLAAYYRADPEGVTTLIEENTLTERQKNELLLGIALALQEDEIVSIGETTTVDCYVGPDSRARTPILLQPERGMLKVKLTESPVPPVIVLLYDSRYDEVVQEGPIEKVGGGLTFQNLTGETSYYVEVVLPEGTPENSNVSLRISG